MADSPPSATVPAAELLDTWSINDRLGRYLLDAIAQEHLGLTLPSKGRTIGKQFGHVHDVRLLWLRAAEPARSEAIEKAGAETVADKRSLDEALRSSGAAIHALLERVIASGGRVKGFKPHVTAFLGYLVAHEAHHRSQVVITLKAAGHALPKEITFGMWEWGVR